MEIIRKLITFLSELINAIYMPPAYDQKPENHPINQEPPKPQAKPDYIALMAQAIRDFEGWHEGSRSFRNNNPGNIKGRDGRFLTFKTPEEGMEYLQDYLRRACTGKHAAYKPSMTLRDFFSVYAPDGEPILSNYTSYVAQKMKVYPSKRLSEFV